MCLKSKSEGFVSDMHDPSRKSVLTYAKLYHLKSVIVYISASRTWMISNFSSSLDKTQETPVMVFIEKSPAYC